MIGGTAQEGQTLTATAAVANDADATVTYQWQNGSGNSWSDISGATGLSYVVQETDETRQIRVVATSTDLIGGTNITSTSTATPAVVDVTPTLSVAVKTYT
jgi:hypothetical protein